MDENEYQSVRSRSVACPELPGYEIASLISGGSGSVYQAIHTRLQRPVVIRCVDKNCVDKSCVDKNQRDPSPSERIDQVLEASGALCHPHLVTAYDAGETDEVFYVVQESVQGIDLIACEKTLGRFPVKAACEIVRQAAHAIQFIHESGRVHGDIKPSKVMLTFTGTVKLLGLGYRRSCSIETDLRGLGTLLFELLKRNKDLSDRSRLSTLSENDFREDVPKAVVAIVLRMRSQDSDNRFEHAGQVAEDLSVHSDASELRRLVSKDGCADTTATVINSITEQLTPRANRVQSNYEGLSSHLRDGQSNSGVAREATSPALQDSSPCLRSRLPLIGRPFARQITVPVLATVVIAAAVMFAGTAGWLMPGQFHSNSSIASAIVVTTLEDNLNRDDQVTLREAIEAATTNERVDGSIAGRSDRPDVIVFQPDLSGTIELNGRALVINSELSIIGPGPDQLRIDALRHSRVIEIAENSANDSHQRQITLSGITVTGGMLTSHAETGSGAGIHIQAGNKVILDDIRVTKNVSAGSYAEGGGVFCISSVLQVLDSTIDNNTSYEGGGIRCREVGSSLDLHRLKIHSNTASIGGGISIARVRDTLISDTIVSGNTATDGASTYLGLLGGGGMFAYASGIQLNRCILKDNQSKYDGAGLFTMANTRVKMHQTQIEHNHRLDGVPSDVAGEASVGR